jgi:hypothetical protein
MTRGGEGEVSPCYSGVSMPSGMEQESLWEAPRTQSAQWNIKNTLRRIHDGVGCRTIPGSTGGGQVDARVTKKTHSSFNKT